MMPKAIKVLGIYLLLGAVGLSAGWLFAHYSNRQNTDLIKTDALQSQQLPDLLWQDLQDKPQNLQQYLGKILIVNHWAPWCEPCREEIPLFMDLQVAKSAQGVQFIGIGHDSPGNVRRFVDEMGINYPQLLAGDSQGMEWMAALGNPGSLPFTSIYDRKGNLIGKKLGLLSAQQIDAIIQSAL